MAGWRATLGHSTQTEKGESVVVHGWMLNLIKLAELLISDAIQLEKLRTL